MMLNVKESYQTQNVSIKLIQEIFVFAVRSIQSTTYELKLII